MLKKIAKGSVIALLLTFLALPVRVASAQSVVTGTNPVPTGEDNAAMALALMSVLSNV